MVRAAEVGVRRDPGLCAGVVRGRYQGSSPLVISLVPSLELSAGDVGKAEGGDVVLPPSLAIGGGVCSVRGLASTGHSLAMSPELSVGDVVEVVVGARLSPELAVAVVEICAQGEKAPSTRMPSRLSVGTVDGRVKQLFSPIL